MFKNGVLRNIWAFEFTGKWRRLHNEELCHMYSSTNIILAIKKNKMGRICSFYGGEERGTYRVVVGKPEGQNRLEDLSVDRSIILKWIFRKWDRDA